MATGPLKEGTDSGALKFLDALPLDVQMKLRERGIAKFAAGGLAQTKFGADVLERNSRLMAETSRTFEDRFSVTP